MEEQLKKIIEHYTLDTFQVALISAVVSIVTFFITNWLKNYFENKLLQRNLETEHTFNQRKKIKEVLAKYKVHLLTACEDLNYRFWNFANTYNENWLDVKGEYDEEHYYFHSFCFRILAVFAWINKIQKEMIFLDTTIASKKDLEFIKFLRVLPQIFCELTIFEGKDANGNTAVDHFFKNNFEILPDCIITKEGINSYSEFIKNLPINRYSLIQFFLFMDGISPTENRKRWDRLHLLNLTLIIFLNNYGYDYQRTNKNLMKDAITKPKVSNYLENYFSFLSKYYLTNNLEVKRFKKIVKSINCFNSTC